MKKEHRGETKVAFSRVHSIKQLSGYERAPLWKTVPWVSFDPWSLYLSIQDQNSYAFIVESGRSGRYTYVGCSPVKTIKIKNNTVIENNGVPVKMDTDPLNVVRRWMEHEISPYVEELEGNGLPDWIGGSIGYLGYDMARQYETIPCSAVDDLDLPDVYLMMMEQIYAFDHVERKVFLIVHVGKQAQLPTIEAGEEKIAEMEGQLGASLQMRHAIQTLEDNDFPETSAVNAPEKSFDQEAFEDAVRKVQEYIAAGDVFQVNLSVRQSKPMDAPAEAVYHMLRRINPSPYMGLLRFPEFQLVSASPELLLQVKGRKLSTRPIAGTRRRGKDDTEDAMLMKELLDNEKEIAEHIMLVDLERNDLGRVSQYGTVHVDELMVVEKYSHVMHIVSNVVGELAENKDMYDAVIAAFPGGTITGAPKVRTMEIIEELEPVTRGPYTGSMCLFGFTGDAVCNIIIRTLIAKDGKAHVQAGAGIVIDSRPKAEYYESLKKAEAVWRALSLAEAEYS